MDLRLLQLADSAFPAGGFAHSAGLESALQQGEVSDPADFERFVNESLWQAGFGALPLAGAGYDRPEEWGKWDDLCDAFLSGHVANRASRVQGRAFFGTCERSFAGAQLRLEGARVRAEGLKRHYAPLFGVVLRALEVGREDMQRLLLFGTLRGLVSAAIRLGVFGPYQAQSVQWGLAPKLEEVRAHCGRLGPDELAQTAPWLEICQSNHDRLYSRLFQS